MSESLVLLTPTMIYDKYFQPLYTHVYTLVDNTEDAKDIVVTTLNKLFARWDKFTTESDMRGFLYKASKNDAFNYLRTRKRNRIKHQQLVQIFGEEADTTYSEIQGLLLIRLNEELEKLPQRTREVIQLLYFEKLSRKEVAERLGIAESTVKSTRAIAIDKLRERLSLDELLILGLIVVGEIKSLI